MDLDEEQTNRCTNQQEANPHDTYVQLSQHKSGNNPELEQEIENKENTNGEYPTNIGE